MMLSGGVWILLLVGVLLTQRWSVLNRHATVIGPLTIGFALLVEIGLQGFTSGSQTNGHLAVVLACCGGAAWMVTLRHHTGHRAWGGVAWTLGGLLVLGQSRDLLLLGLGWEILRQGVRLTAGETASPRHSDPLWLLSGGWWTAVAGLLLFGGTTEIDGMMHVARQLYTPVNQAEPLGRASLLLVGAMALLIVSVGGAMLLPPAAEERDDADSRRIAACGRMHLQWAAGFILAAILSTGCPGMSGSVTVLMSLLIAAAWGLAAMSLGSMHRWCELTDAAVRFHGGAILFVVWLRLAEVPQAVAMPGTLLSSAPTGLVWGQELLHGAVALTGLFAALSRRSDEEGATDFIEAARGAGTSNPWSVLWTLLPLASLIGFPGLWGSWTRLASTAAVLSVQSMREDELAIPNGSIIVVAAVGLLSTGYLLRGLVQIVSVMVWEPLIGRPRSPGQGWPQGLAGVLGIMLLLVGLCPIVLIAVMTWIGPR